MLLDQRTHAVTVELTRPGEVGNIYRSTRQVQRQSVTITLCVFQRRQPLQIFRLTLPATRRIERDHARTGQRRASRNITQHQTVVIRQPQRRIENQLRQRAFEQLSAVVLAPVGGPLLEGFTLPAPAHWRA